MKLGFKLRKFWTNCSDFLRRILNLVDFFCWALFDFSKFKKINNKNIKNLLVVSRGAIGDLYNVLGIINQLSEKYPNLNIFYNTNNENERFIKNPKIKFSSINLTKKLMQKKQFQAAIILGSYPNGLKSPKDVFNFLKIPYRSINKSISLTNFFKEIPLPYTRRVFPFYQGFENYLRAFNKLGFNLNYKPSFYFTKEGKKEAELFKLQNNILAKDKLIFLHPGAGTITRAKKEGKCPSHEWPEENWVRLTELLIKKHNCKIIFTGNDQYEKETISRIISFIENKKQVINSVGKLSIEGIASLMYQGDLLITIDTGMAHIGAQAGIYLIDLFGPFPPQLADPITSKKKIIFHDNACNSCRKYFCPEKNPVCMKSISVDEIFKESNKI